MATIITLQSSDQISASRADINTSLANLNADKIETSVIDTDTALAANSDAKLPSQKAIKAYVDATSSTPTVRNGLTSKSLADANTTQNIAHGLGKAPRKVRFTATMGNGTFDAQYSGMLTGVYDAGGQNCIGLMIDGTSNEEDKSFTNATALKLPSTAAVDVFQVGTVSVDATNIAIAWVKTGSPAETWNILWEAE